MEELSAYVCMGFSLVFYVFIFWVLIRFIYRRIWSSRLLSQYGIRSCPACGSDTYRYKFETFNRNTGEKSSIFDVVKGLFFGLPMVIFGGIMAWIGVDEMRLKGVFIRYTDVNIPFLGNPIGWLVIGLGLLVGGAAIAFSMTRSFYGAYFSRAIGNRFELTCKNCSHEWQRIVS